MNIQFFRFGKSHLQQQIFNQLAFEVIYAGKQYT